jgi:hypothetical protein
VNFILSAFPNAWKIITEKARRRQQSVIGCLSERGEGAKIFCRSKKYARIK